MELEKVLKSQLRVKQKCLSSIISNVKTTKMNFEKFYANKFSKAIISIRFNLLHVYPSMPPFAFVVLFILSFHVLRRYFYVSLSLVASSHCLNFDKFRQDTVI